MTSERKPAQEAREQTTIFHSAHRKYLSNQFQATQFQETASDRGEVVAAPWAFVWRMRRESMNKIPKLSMQP